MRFALRLGCNEVRSFAVWCICPSRTFVPTAYTTIRVFKILFYQKE